MPIFKKTQEILANPWSTHDVTVGSNPSLLPPRLEWNHSKDLKFSDIVLWEQIYYQPGNIGIYASWDPYAEFYIIVYNLFAKSDLGVEKYYGRGATNKVLEQASKLGIHLEKNQIWVDDQNLWVHND
jgi:hypothetical protein